MEVGIEIRRYDNLPSSLDFGSQIESRNVPAVFNGCVKDWIAFSKWNPSNGGLDYLQERVGSSIVEAMLSRDAPVFYGDLKSHERVPLQFSSFIGFCKQSLLDTRVDDHACLESEMLRVAASDVENDDSLSVDASPQQIYLAQVPIMNAENEERVHLEALLKDIHTPAIIETKEVSSINLWMNNARARSSTHYDPNNNLLCIVSGCKQVDLWPPSATHLLYPRPVYGEASNHSSVALENPNFTYHPRAERLMEYSQKVILRAGDALFIPEGWFHQVDSDDLTIAVNFWWQSSMMSSMAEHMDSYYLRRILRRLTDKEMNQVLSKSSSSGLKNIQKPECVLPNFEQSDYKNDDLEQCQDKNNKGRKLKKRTAFHELQPNELQALRELVSLVHDGVQVCDHSQLDQSTSSNIASTSIDKSELKKTVVADLYHLEDDPVAKIIWSVDPHALQNVFLVMVNNFPRTLEAMILHLLSPVGAEVLTRKFDEMDQINHDEDRNEFYQAFYGVFEDQFAAMDSILKGKELFALQAFKNVLDEFVGVNFEGPKSVVD